MSVSLSKIKYNDPVRNKKTDKTNTSTAETINPVQHGT